MATALIEGYAALFNLPDLSGDVIRPGAFRTALKTARNIRMLYQHTAERPIGRWLSLKEDARGLFVRGELLLDSADAQETWTLLSGHALDGLSIGFTTGKARRAKAGRELLQLDLWEVSIVTFPMMPGARITRVGPAQSALTRLRASTTNLKKGKNL